MDKSKTDESHYNNFYSWLEDTKSHEITHVVELVDGAKQWLKCAENIPEEKCVQFIENFKLDLFEFYQHSQEAIKHSLYASILGESFWTNIADITDRSQVEWSELLNDIEHDGLYEAGDYIGFGEIACLNCGDIQPIYHLTSLTSCIKCNGSTFTRKSLTP